MNINQVYIHHLTNANGKKVCTIAWDIGLANQIIRTCPTVNGAPRPCLELPKGFLEDIAVYAEYDEAYSRSADYTEPGISAPVVTDDGTLIYTLIDGRHRAMRALREGRPFKSWFLSDQESRACILICTDEKYLPPLEENDYIVASDAPATYIAVADEPAVLDERRKEAFWKWLLKQTPRPKGATDRRLERIKPAVMKWQDFWIDVKRHVYPQTPLDKIDTATLNHLRGNAWGMITEALYKSGLVKP